MAVVAHIKNPFDPINSRDILLVDGGRPIHTYFGGVDSAYDVVASVNGVIVEDFEYIVAQNDSIAFVAIPQGGDDGKNILRIVAMIVVSYYAGPAAGAILGTTEGLAYGILAGAFTAIGGMIVNALLPIPTPDFNNPANSGYSSSPTYGWGDAFNPVQEGAAIPVVYGTARVIPPVISQYVETIGSKQYLNILYAVNDGEVTSISDIEINGNPVALYSGVTTDVRLGTNTQTLIPAFDNTRVDIGVSTKLTTSFTTRTTESNTVEQLEVYVTAPNGMYYANDLGGLNSRTVYLEVQFREIGTGTWFDIATPAYISGAKAGMIRVKFTVSNLSPAQYEIQVRRTSTEVSNSRTMEAVYFDSFTEVIYDDFTYPNTALLAVRALATDQLSGNRPTVSCVVQAQTNNPSEVVQDILTSELYGARVPLSNINTTRFDEWTAFCTANGLTCNVIFDSSLTVRDAINQVSQLGRAIVVQAGAEFLPIIDRVENLAVQRFLFTMGNIAKDSFKQEFLSLEDRASVIEVTYFDENLGYERQSVELWQSGVDDSDTDLVRSAVTLYGCTDRDMAVKHGRYLLNRNRYLTQTVSFEADVDAIACQIGDLIDVAHDVPQWGYSGRIVGQYVTADSSLWVYEPGVYEPGVYVDSTSEIPMFQLDREVTLEAGVTYSMTVKYNSTDTRETVQFTPTETTITNEVPATLSAALEPYMLYSIGVYDETAPVYVATHSKLFRVASITRSGDQRRKLSAIEYVPEVYDDSADAIPVVTVTGLGSVSNLTAYYAWTPNINGVGASVVNLDWTGQALAWDVWYRDVTSSEFIYAGQTLTSDFQIQGLPAAIYEFKVDEETVGLEVLGQPGAPTAPTSVTAALIGNQLVAEWPAVTYEGAVGYNVKVNSTLVSEGFSGTQFTYSGALTPGTYTVYVASVNAYGQTSAYQASNTVTIDAVPSITDVTPYSKAAAVQFYVQYTAFDAFDYIQPYESLDTNFANADALAPEKVRNFTRSGLPLIDTRYYWFELVDVFGNKGALFGPVTGTTATDSSALLALLKDQQGTEQYLPSLSDILISGLVGGQAVVGVDGSLVVDQSLVASKLSADEAWIDGFLKSSNYSWNGGAPIGFGMWSVGDPDSGNTYNLVGGSIYGTNLTGATLDIQDINIKDTSGNTLAATYGGSASVSFDAGIDTFTISTGIVTTGNAPFNALQNNSYLTIMHTVDVASVAPYAQGYSWLFSCDDSSVPVTVLDGTTTRFTGTVSSDGDTTISTSGIIIHRVTDGAYTNTYHYYIKENLVPNVLLNTGLNLEFVQTDGTFSRLSTFLVWQVSNM